MKMRWLFVSVLALILAGCASLRNHDRQVGSLTYDEAVAELGDPAVVILQPDGSRDVIWLGGRSSPAPLEPGRGGTANVEESPPPLPGDESRAQSDRYLQFSFGPDGVLKSWKQQGGR